MGSRVFVHVGLPKSGTTYLQGVLGTNKERLASEAGLLYPGTSWSAQVHAATDLLALHLHGWPDPSAVGAWDRLVAEIDAWPGSAVISMEWLGSADADQVRRLVESFAPGTVDVIVTARDLGRTLPAAWQEFVRNYEVWTWPDFLSAVTADDPYENPAGHLFWTQQDLERVVEVWQAFLPADRVHVVTLPPPGGRHDELWQRFAGVLGVDPELADTSPAVTEQASNRSLGRASADLMRQVNERGRAAGLEWPGYHGAFKTVLAQQVLAPRSASEEPIVVPAELEGWARTRADRIKKALSASGVDLVGDLDDLDPVLEAEDGRPDAVSDDTPLDAALDGLVALAQERDASLRRLEALNRELVAANESDRREHEAREREHQAREDALRREISELETSLVLAAKRRFVRAGEQGGPLGAVLGGYRAAKRFVPVGPRRG
jgi:hypothetical protein